MGGGDWIEQKQMIQQDILNRAYDKVVPKGKPKEVKAEKKTAIVEEVVNVETQETLATLSVRQPDGIDMAYVWARTFTPSWVMALIFILGIITLIPIVLNKFGISMGLTFKKRGGE